MTQAQYRSDYDGEFVIVTTNIQNGVKQQQREWIPNPIINQHISNRAAVIGSNIDVHKFKYSRLQRHRGGLQGTKRLQTYGTGSIWRDMTLNFYCSTNQEQLAEIHKTQYCDNTVVYTGSRYCLKYPGSFYLIPFQPNISDLASCIYLAAFDGHQEIFLLGYNKDTPGDHRCWVQHVQEVMTVYSTHQFIFVGVEANMPDEWRSLDNVDFWNYRYFITHCDI